MSSFFIISVIANDRPGLVETLSKIVTEHQGNWLESRLAHMAGKFAGIVQVQVSDQHSSALLAELNQLNQQGWIINIEQSQAQSNQDTPCAKLNIIGNDRPGIVKDVSQALAKLGVNVLELNTKFESAAMSAEALFKTQAQIQLPDSLELDDVRDVLENISNDLMVEITSLK